MDKTTRAIEAILFLTGEAVAKRELAAAVHLERDTIEVALSQLQAELAEHGISLVVTATHAQLTTSSSVADLVRQFKETEAVPLSAAALETLSLVAYRGPLTRFEIEGVRGVDCRRMMRQLVARGLVAKLQKTDGVTQYDITEDFLHHAGLTRREELPQFQDLSSHERLTAWLAATHDGAPTA